MEEEKSQHRKLPVRYNKIPEQVIFMLKFFIKELALTY